MKMSATNASVAASVAAEAIGSGHIANIVDAANLDARLPHIWKALQECSFLAIDTEFTGLGSSPDWGHSNLRLRYHALRNHVNNYALLQIGLSFFKRTNSGGGSRQHQDGQSHADVDDIQRALRQEGGAQGTAPSAAMAAEVAAASGVPQKRKRRKRRKTIHRYDTVTYTVNVVQEEDFVVSASSLKFLAKSGVRLDTIFKDGIPFHFCFEDDRSQCLHCVRTAANQDLSLIHI